VNNNLLVVLPKSLAGVQKLKSCWVACAGAATSRAKELGRLQWSSPSFYAALKKCNGVIPHDKERLAVLIQYSQSLGSPVLGRAMVDSAYLAQFGQRVRVIGSKAAIREAPLRAGHTSDPASSDSERGLSVLLGSRPHHRRKGKWARKAATRSLSGRSNPVVRRDPHVAADELRRKVARRLNDEGMASYRAGNFAVAVERFRNAAFKDCDYVLARLNLAATLSRVAKNGAGHEETVKALEAAYRTEPELTLRKVHNDPDYKSVTSSDKFRQPEAALKYRSAHPPSYPPRQRYADTKRGISFEYPGYFGLKVHCDLGGTKDLPNVCLQDRDFEGSEVGGGEPVQVSYFVYASSAYARSNHVDLGVFPAGKPVKTIAVPGKEVQRLLYEGSGPECENRFLELVEIPRSAEILLLRFDYGVWGCSCWNIPRAECERDASDSLKRSRAVIEQVTRTFIF
jgi:hypothetical protein